MTELTYKQKCAKHFDRNYTKKELIWAYIDLAEKFDALTKVMRQQEVKE